LVGKTYIVKVTPNNNRLAEMGIIRGTTFRIVKRVAGMIQIRLTGSDIVIREELFKEIDYDDKR
jgi:Fe2+ transport system protein FeoA